MHHHKRQSMVWIGLTVLVLLLLSEPKSVDSAVYNITPATQNWIQILGSLQAGDSAYLAPGTYTKTAKLTLSLVGTVNAPILVSGIMGQARPVINHQGQNQNIMDVVEGSYFTIQYLELTGGSLGVRLGPSSINTLNNGIIQNCSIHDTAETAVSANFANHVFYNFTFRFNEIYNTGSQTGECFYLGCVSGCYIYDSEISNNLLHDTLQATLGSVGSAIQVKDDSYNVVVKNNVCYNLGGPCVLLYSDGGKGRNSAIGNVILSTNDNGIQAAAGANIINNLIMNTGGDGIAIIQNPAGVTIANITILHNTVINSAGYGLRATNFVKTYPFLIANNAFYCDKSVGGTSDVSGVPFISNGYSGSIPTTSSTNAFFALGAPTSDLQGDQTNYNLYPKAGSSLITHGNGTYSVAYDFNQNPRSATTPTVGAYEYTTTSNPGWTVGKTFKQLPTGASATPVSSAAASGSPTNSPKVSGTASTSLSVAPSVSAKASGSTSTSISGALPNSPKGSSGIASTSSTSAASFSTAASGTPSNSPRGSSGVASTSTTPAAASLSMGASGTTPSTLPSLTAAPSAGSGSVDGSVGTSVDDSISEQLPTAAPGSASSLVSWMTLF